VFFLIWIIKTDFVWALVQWPRVPSIKFLSWWDCLEPKNKNKTRLFIFTSNSAICADVLPYIVRRLYCPIHPHSFCRYLRKTKWLPCNRHVQRCHLKKENLSPQYINKKYPLYNPPGCLLRTVTVFEKDIKTAK